MSKETNESCEEKWFWTSKCREDVINHFLKENITHKNIQNNPTWHVYPHVAIWLIEDKVNPESVAWWATSGDGVLTDHVSAVDFPTPRLALIELASQWRDSAAQILEEGKNNPSAVFFEDISYEDMASEINSTADFVIKLSNDLGGWNTIEDRKPAKEIVLNQKEESAFKRFVEHAKKLSSDHQIEIGIAEMALGAALIAWGVQNDVIEMGRDVVATAFSENDLSQKVGAAFAGSGALGGYILGSIGVVAMGGAIGIPLGIVAAGGAAIFGAMGYTATDIISKFTQVDYVDFLGGASIMAAGIALLIDGARRVVKDVNILETTAKIKDGIIYIYDLTAEVVARSMSELKEILKKYRVGAIGVGGGVVGGAALGSVLAASSVTVLGSSSLGAVALSLGLVSAPIWPVVAGGLAGAAAIGAAVYYFTNNPEDKLNETDVIKKP